MEKLLQLISKLREEIVPDQPLSKMTKEDVLRFIEDASIIKRMRAFHQKGDRGIRSAITEDEDDSLVPSEAELSKWRVGKLRKLVRDFHRATQITKKYTKFSASRLRSHIKRHRYEEMLLATICLNCPTPTTKNPKSVRVRDAARVQPVANRGSRTKCRT